MTTTTIVHVPGGWAIQHRCGNRTITTPPYPKRETLETILRRRVRILNKAKKSKGGSNE
jgi:hypothetical protein